MQYASRGQSEKGIYPYKDGFGIRYKDAHGKDRVKAGFKTKTEAMRERARLMGLSLDGQATVPDVFPRLADVIKQYVATSTKKRPRDDRLHGATWTEILGHLRVDELSRAHIRSLKKTWAPQLAAATINRRLAWLSALLNYAIDEGWDIKNPVQQEGLVRGFDNRRKRELHADEEQLLRATWERLGFPDREFWKVEFAIHTSVRQSEQFDMRWEHVDFRAGLIAFPNTKPGRSKDVYMTKRVRVILEQLHAERDPEVPWVWVGPKGGKQHIRNWLRDFWEPAIKESGLKNLCWHDLRHTAASRLRRAGVELDVLQEILGQSDIRMVQRYAHIGDETRRAAMGHLDGPGS